VPDDLAFDRTAGAGGAAIFRHSTHLAFGGVRCVACHPAPFSILHPVRRTSHDEMNAGRSCGSCHDGRSAFATTGDQNCAVCHPGLGKPTDFKLRDVVIHRSADSPEAVLFRHATHAGTEGGCARCHPAPFALKAEAFALKPSGGGKPSAPGTGGAPSGSTPLPAQPPGHEACGSCHDGRAAFAVDDDAACQRCHGYAGGAP
jgi:c(7)-type cytochrome triheme protein